MTKEELIDMARQAGARQMVSSLTHPNGPVTALKFDLDSESIEAFAKLVAEKAFQDGYSIGEAAGFKQAIKLERARGEA